MVDAPALDELIVEQASDPVICADTTGAIIRWNAAASDLFGYSAQEALGQGLDLIIPPHLRAAHWNGFRQAIETGETKHQGKAVLTGAVHKDGTRIYAEMSFSLVKNPERRVVGVVAIARPKVREC
jgi:PAS domain S-box-containing protein